MGDFKRAESYTIKLLNQYWIKHIVNMEFIIYIEYLAILYNN